MRKLLFAAALACGVIHTVSAGEFLVAPTKEGGEIVLTFNTPSACNGLFFMYLVDKNQIPFYGCWTLINDKVHVRYDNGIRRVYGLGEWSRRESM